MKVLTSRLVFEALYTPTHSPISLPSTFIYSSYTPATPDSTLNFCISKPPLMLRPLSSKSWPLGTTV